MSAIQNAKQPEKRFATPLPELNRSYDIVVVGAGLYGCIFAGIGKRRGKRVIVVEKNRHIGGMCYDEFVCGVGIHKYGPHIFHTRHKVVWDFVSRFSQLNNYQYKAVVNWGGKVFSFPVNLLTMQQLGWDVITPNDGRRELAKRVVPIENPANFEEAALSTVGEEIYTIFFRDYTEKQWGRPCTEVPATVFKRIPVRFSYDDRYFDDPYQGLPVDGYTNMISRILGDVPVELETEWTLNSRIKGDLVVYTGEIDKLMNYRFGKLEYRSLRFEVPGKDIPYSEDWDVGCGVMNFTGREVSYTRVTNYNRMYFMEGPVHATVEYPQSEGEPFYPVKTRENNKIWQQYVDALPRGIVTGGRLGDYQYRNMDDTVLAALEAADRLL